MGKRINRPCNEFMASDFEKGKHSEQDCFSVGKLSESERQRSRVQYTGRYPDVHREWPRSLFGINSERCTGGATIPSAA
ncbi:MAG: hypothetical protein PF436_05530 [Prolixibacteraceae bacterium]|nr:hypothetical protein [Prolixibacteraceae bacterium]